VRLNSIIHWYRKIDQVIDMADTALIVIASVEEPIPQTRFIVQKAIQKTLCDRKLRRPPYGQYNRGVEGHH
jgi:hypothetical protein